MTFMSMSKTVSDIKAQNHAACHFVSLTKSDLFDIINLLEIKLSNLLFYKFEKLFSNRRFVIFTSLRRSISCASFRY